MRTIKLSFLSYCTFPIVLFVLTSCQKTEDFNKNVSLVQQTISTDKISAESIYLSVNDATNVAKIFKGANSPTKSLECMKVTSVVPITNENGNTVIYAVNFTDGYVLISATKRFFPILAKVDHGSFSLNTNTGQDCLVSEMIQSISTVDNDSTNQVSGIHWLPYEKQITLSSTKTKTNSDYYTMLDTYLEDWYNDGRNVYYLYNKPDNMPDDMYNSFYTTAENGMAEIDGYPFRECAVITEKFVNSTTQKGPLVETLWGQDAPYNSLFPNHHLGCVTIATGQIMKYFEFPSSYNWSQMPNSTSSSTLASFLFSLRNDLNVTDDGTSTINNAKNVFNDYGYSCNIISHSETQTKASLNSNKPVYMRGTDINDSSIGHAWVCDGYQHSIPTCEYTLYLPSFNYNDEPYKMDEWRSESIYDNAYNLFHMNWGWDGDYNGFFIENNLNLQGINHNFTSTRRDIIISGHN